MKFTKKVRKISSKKELKSFLEETGDEEFKRVATTAMEFVSTPAAHTAIKVGRIAYIGLLSGVGMNVQSLHVCLREISVNSIVLTEKVLSTIFNAIKEE